jgi:hypothetical protein
VIASPLEDHPETRAALRPATTIASLNAFIISSFRPRPIPGDQNV